jgi:hypothetical protein
VAGKRDGEHCALWPFSRARPRSSISDAARTGPDAPPLHEAQLRKVVGWPIRDPGFDTQHRGQRTRRRPIIKFNLDCYT